MKKKFLIFFTIIISSEISLAQISPQTFYMPSDHKSFKIADQNPSSNGISDIIAVGDTIWLGTSNGVSLSTDEGDSWTNFGGKSPFGNTSASAIGYYKGIFWVATATSTEVNSQSLPEGTGIKFTTDLGQTWHSIPQSVDSQSDSVIVYGINQIRALPVTVAIQNLTYDIAFTPNYIWTANFAGGLRRARIDSLIANPNYKWERVVIPPDYLNSISPYDTLNFCLSPVSGNFCSESNLNHRLFSVISTNDSTLFVGTAGGINKTTDADSLYPSWTKFTHKNQEYPISGNFVVALGYNDNTNTVWAATWQAEDPTEFYAVSRSTDSGSTWGTFLEGEQAHNFGFKGNSVIAATDDGPYRSTDLGTSWILPTSIIDQDTHLSISNHIFYAAAESQDTYVWLGSTDGLARLQEIPGSVWEGTWKVYFASVPLVSKEDTYAFPNPFSPKLDICKIKYSTGGKRTNVTIRIFNFDMKYVRTVVQNVLRGEPLHSVDASGTSSNGVIDFWDGKDDNGNIVPNGVYFYRVDVDGLSPAFGKIIVLQ